MAELFLALTIFFFTFQISDGSRPEFIIWNVGQGLWVTSVTSVECDHFDMGGEKIDFAEIVKLCGHKKNKFFFSHWDWDHIGFVKKYGAAFNDPCIGILPAGETKAKNLKMMNAFPMCSEIPKDLEILSPEKAGKTNELSHIFSYHSILVPGDSPKAQEKKWVSTLHSREKIKFLVLGHHGSRTSTSPALLNELPHVELAISSARMKKYGHPHIEVVRRLKEAGISLLRTEIWGNIHIQQPF